jgi:SAM-dependent methyltransferase
MARTTEVIDQTGGSAAAQRDLWAERANDWANVMEGWDGWGVPLYRQVLQRLNISAGTDVLDVGCGAGRFCRIAADRGARVSGIDATGPFIETAKQRIRGGDFRVGDMEALPWVDEAFDVVTGFNSFFFAADLSRALREARRVTRAGGEVALTVFGRPEQCESTAMFAALGQLLPSAAGEPDGGPVLYQDGVLESLAEEAGLVPREAGFLEIAEEYPDVDTLLRGYLAHGSIVKAMRSLGEQPVRDALTAGVRELMTVNGGVRIEDEYRYLITTR